MCEDQETLMVVLCLCGTYIVCYWDLIRANCFCRWLCQQANTCWQVWRPSTKHTAWLKILRSVSLWVKGLWKYIWQKNRGQLNFQKWLKWQKIVIFRDIIFYVMRLFLFIVYRSFFYLKRGLRLYIFVLKVKPMSLKKKTLWMERIAHIFF